MNSQPKTFSKEVWYQNLYQEWKLADFIALLQEQLAAIPADERASAIVAFDRDEGLSISYTHTETPDEVSARIAAQEEWDSRR